jgi:hypothetical protein
MNPLIQSAGEWTLANLIVFGHSGPGWAVFAALLLFLLGVVWPVAGFAGGGGVREPILAGRWYEGNRSALAASVEAYLAGKERPDVPVPEGAAEAREWAARGRAPVAVIVPHAGHVYSGECAGQAFRLLEASSYRRVILIGPSHSVPFRGAALPDENAFSTPLGAVPLDRSAIDRLKNVEGFQVLPRAHAQEHSLEIEIPFLQKVLPAGFELVPIVIGGLDDAAAQSIARAIGELWDRETLVTISSDFTHFGPNYDYVPFRDRIPDRLYKLDHGAVDRILALDPSGFESYLDSTDATICGAGPIRILLRAARGRSLTGKLVEYYRSGDKTGDFQNSVSYAAIAFFPADASGNTLRKGSEGASGNAPGSDAPAFLSVEEQSYLLRLARRTLQALVEGESFRPPEEPGAPPESSLREPRGVFVTLTGPGGELRGCIGNITGEQPLLDGVRQNTIAAASRDPRFMPVRREEEPHLRIEISVLTPMRQVSGPEQIVIGQDGVVLEKGGRRAVFLPQVAPEQGWDVPEMLRHLALKAGLSPNEWKSGAKFYTFQAQVFEEESPGGGHER